MRTDSIEGIQGALGLIEDEMQTHEHEYAAAAGWMAEWEHWHRREYLVMREGLKAQNTWPPGTTETQKKDDIEFALQSAHPEKYAELQTMARKKAIGDKLFASQDARRSIGQTLLKPHMVLDGGYGQGGRGLSGTPEPQP
jgi:hypothetical protein